VPCTSLSSAPAEWWSRNALLRIVRIVMSNSPLRAEILRAFRVRLCYVCRPNGGRAAHGARRKNCDAQLSAVGRLHVLSSYDCVKCAGRTVVTKRTAARRKDRDAQLSAACGDSTCIPCTSLSFAPIEWRSRDARLHVVKIVIRTSPLLAETSRVSHACLC